MCAAGTTAQFPECMLDFDMAAFERIGADYIEKIRKYSNDAEYITDKLPYNFLYVGLIKTILPDAKIIHCMRNPMDNCYSLFKNYFKETHGYAYDMDELGQYYNLYQDLMAHWEKVLPGFMYTIRYEEVVSDQQNQTKSLLGFCGLPWTMPVWPFTRQKGGSAQQVLHRYVNPYTRIRLNCGSDMKSSLSLFEKQYPGKCRR